METWQEPKKPDTADSEKSRREMMARRKIEDYDMLNDLGLIGDKFEPRDFDRYNLTGKTDDRTRPEILEGFENREKDELNRV